MPKLFLYLAGRSKKGIKLIAVLDGEETSPSRLTDLKRAGLPWRWETQISRIIAENRMRYEPWLESANSYRELKDRLQLRGYAQLPMGITPLLDLGTNPPRANTSGCRVRRVMVQRSV